MCKSSVRLALIGSASEIAKRSGILDRIGHACVIATADSMKALLLREDINTSDFDGVVVSSVEDARCAAQGAKHVLVDASFAESFQEAESLIEICQKTNVHLALGGLPRFAPTGQIIIQRLKAGKLGLPGLLRVHRWSNNADQTVTSTVYGDIDLALHLFQATPTEIYAIGRGNHSYIQVHLGFPEGGMAILDFANGLPSGPTYNSLSLIGSKGAAYADDHHNTHLLFTGEIPNALISPAGTADFAALQQFANCIVSGTSPSMNIASILSAHRVTDAIRRSVESNNCLRLRGGEYEPA